MGSYARIFDTIQHQYGWSDDQCLDLTLRRMRQISDAIAQRRYSENLRAESLLEWQTKAITTQLANLGTSKKHAGAMHNVAASFTLRDHRTKGRQSERDEGWTPDTPVDYNDPKFARQSLGPLLSMVNSIERER